MLKVSPKIPGIQVLHPKVVSRLPGSAAVITPSMLEPHLLSPEGNCNMKIAERTTTGSKGAIKY